MDSLELGVVGGVAAATAAETLSDRFQAVERLIAFALKVLDLALQRVEYRLAFATERLKLLVTEVVFIPIWIHDNNLNVLYGETFRRKHAKSDTGC